MSNIIKCENCGCEEIDIIHKYKGYYVCPKCGRDTERLYEIEHDKEIRAKAIDEFAEMLKEKYEEHNLDLCLRQNDYCSYANSCRQLENYIDKIAEQMKAGGIE